MSSMESTQHNQTDGGKKKPLKDQCQVFTVDETAGSNNTTSVKSTREQIAKQEQGQKAGKKWAVPRPSLERLPSIPPSLFILCISFLLQLGFSLYVLSNVLHSVDSALIYSICFLLLNLGSSFCSFEVIYERSKKLVIVSFAVSLLVLIVAVVILILLAKEKRGEVDVDTERMVALTILVQFVHMLALGHFAYEKFVKGPKQPLDLVLPCTCRPSEEVAVVASRPTVSSRPTSTPNNTSKSRLSPPQSSGAAPSESSAPEASAKMKKRPMRYIVDSRTGELKNNTSI